MAAENGWDEHKRLILDKLDRIENRLASVESNSMDRLRDLELDTAKMKQNFRWLYGVGMVVLPAAISIVVNVLLTRG